MFKRGVMNNLGVLVREDDGDEADLRAGLGYLARAAASCTWWLGKPSFSVDEANTDFRLAAEEQVKALAQILGTDSLKSIVHQVLHMPPAVIDHGEICLMCTLLLSCLQACYKGCKEATNTYSLRALSFAYRSLTGCKQASYQTLLLASLLTRPVRARTSRVVTGIRSCITCVATTH